ncbi:hypothetical protein EBZ37_09105 [bacterium]|nr:hypothetical protein [bacterium]
MMRVGIYLFIAVWSFCGSSPSAWADSSEACQQVQPYRWPRNLDALLQQGEDIRLKLLGDEMNRFSAQVGVCYGRAPVGKAEMTWASGERQKRINKIFEAKNVQGFCDEVKKNLIDKKLPNWSLTAGRSRFTQYANCGEGAFVGACLAYAYGFSQKDILICDSAHDHSWSLVPEPHKPGSYCLLDRWNSFRCGVTFSGKQEDGFFEGNFQVPDKQKFKFSDSLCRSLEVYL